MAVEVDVGFRGELDGLELERGRGAPARVVEGVSEGAGCAGPHEWGAGGEGEEGEQKGPVARQSPGPRSATLTDRRVEVGMPAALAGAHVGMVRGYGGVSREIRVVGQFALSGDSDRQRVNQRRGLLTPWPWG